MTWTRPRAWRTGRWCWSAAGWRAPERSPRCCMLKALFPPPLALGLAQPLVAALAAGIVVLLARRRGIHLESETAIAMVRGIVQIVAVGSILVVLLRGPWWTSGFLLAAMIV